jgi:hypothetical protein
LVTRNYIDGVPTDYDPNERTFYDLLMMPGRSIEVYPNVYNKTQVDIRIPEFRRAVYNEQMKLYANLKIKQHM